MTCKYCADACGHGGFVCSCKCHTTNKKNYGTRLKCGNETQPTVSCNCPERQNGNWVVEATPHERTEGWKERIRDIRFMATQEEVEAVIAHEIERARAEEREQAKWNLLAQIEEADYARKVGEKTGNAEAVYAVQEVIRQIQALSPTRDDRSDKQQT